MDLFSLLRRRRATRAFRPGRTVTDAELAALFAAAIESPSSFNLQHWRFVVVRDPARLQRLAELAWGQRQVATASAVVIVFGHLKAHRDAPAIYADAPEALRERVVPLISGFYQGNPQLQRDEAIRSGSLAAMTFMLAAEAHGLATCPMIGFDPEGVSALAGADELHVPVMMICLGEAAGDAPPRAHRFPLSHVVRLETLDGPGLSVPEA